MTVLTPDPVRAPPPSRDQRAAEGADAARVPGRHRPARRIHGVHHPGEPLGVDGHLPGGTARKHRRRAVSPLTLRILAVNMIALLVLMGGLLFVGRYYEQLIESELDALKTQAKLFAAAIAEGSVVRDGHDRYFLAPGLARPMVRRLYETTQTRTWLFDQAGLLVADSHRLIGDGGVIRVVELPPPQDGRLSTRIIVAVEGWIDGMFRITPDAEPFPTAPNDTVEPYRNAVSALDGDISGDVWLGDDGNAVLVAAAPVQHFKEIKGVVLLRRDTADIDEAIRSVRIDILEVFATSLLVTVLLSLYLANTIARPLYWLADAAERVRASHARHNRIPDFTNRGDEIGELSAALREMTESLRARMEAIERFAADVSHEIKNPLSSLRSAVETVARIDDGDQQKRLMTIIQEDVQRLDRLISDISDFSRLDAELSREGIDEEPVEIVPMLSALAEVHSATREAAGHGPALVRFETDDPPPTLTLTGVESRLVQVFQNLITNAVSFSPEERAVTLSAHDEDGWAVIRVEDEGPGIPDAKLEAIFDRFYSERPKAEKFGTHSGLGLAISRQIVRAHGGEIIAENRRNADGSTAGAVFTVRLPLP